MYNLWKLCKATGKEKGEYKEEGIKWRKIREEKGHRLMEN